MNSAARKEWSVGLRKTTRDILDELPILSDGILHMKHVDGGSGTMDMIKILGSCYEIVVRPDGRILTFADIDAVIDAGWVVD